MNRVVITCLLTAEPDPQRGSYMVGHPEAFRVLRDSVHFHGQHLVVLHDGCLTEPDDALTTFVAVAPGGNPYWVRWRHIHDWLTTHAVGWAWAVDATDTEMLHNPFPHMLPGYLYTGSEEELLGSRNPWLYDHCASETDFYDAYPNRPILNMGLLGGDRDVMREAAHALYMGERHGDDWELGVFQRIGYERFAGRLVTGPLVHSRFRAEDRKAAAWWRHK